MKPAHEYAVKYPYGLTSNGWSVQYPHRGNDRPTPTGTPVVIGNTVIGLTGDTGKAIGAHLHTQAGVDKACQITFKPNRLEFQPGTVVATRETDEKEWGKFVTIQVGKEYITYAHLSKVNVKVGDVIKPMTTVSLEKYKKLEALAEDRGKQIVALKSKVTYWRNKFYKIEKLAEDRGHQIAALKTDKETLWTKVKGIFGK